MSGEVAIESPPATILVVEDEPLVRCAISRWLADDGFRCLEAEDAASAWRRLQDHRVDLVTSDINMPGKSGVELLRQIREAFPEMAVLMLTACHDTEVAIRALTQGAFGYLLKPIQRDELLFQVKQGLERTLLRRERARYTEELECRVREQTSIIRSAHEETIHRLITAAAYRDEETGAHIRRTGLFSEALARAAGWSHADCDLIRMAAPMHDVGKIGIPDAILRKPGRLTAEEFDVMKRHTTIGAQMLSGSASPILQMACVLARHHHERWDGSGYPNGVKREEIPESARILAIVDVYDALTHDRVYRRALPEDEVIDMLRQGIGTHFDPGLLALFFTIDDEIRDLAERNPDQSSDAGAGKLIDAITQSTISENPARITTHTRLIPPSGQ